MKKLFITLLLAAVSIVSYAGPEATYNKLRITYTLSADGAQEMNYHKEMTYHTQTSFNSLFGETFVTFNPNYQRVTVNQSYTIQSDGTRINTPENAFNYVLPSGATDAPEYNYMQELVITHTGLEMGATVYLDYTLSTKAGYLPALDFVLPLRDMAAIKDAVITVIVPQGTPVNRSYACAKESKKTANGNDTYTFTFRNLSVVPNVSYVPAYHATLPYLAVNTHAGDPFDVIKKAFDAAPSSPELDALAKKLGSKEAVEKFMASQMATCRLSIQDAGYRMRAPQDIYASAYGTQAECTLLSFVLQRQLGLKPAVYPVYNTALKATDAKAVALASLNSLSLAPQEDPKTFQVNDEKDIVIGASDVNGGLFTLPASPQGVASLRLTLNSKRTVPMTLPAPVEESYRYTLSCKDGLHIDFKPVDKHIANEVGNVDIVFAKEGNNVVVTRRIVISKPAMTAAQYASFRALMQAWSGDNTVIVLP